jgi:hypothetical protein
MVHPYFSFSKTELRDYPPAVSGLTVLTNPKYGAEH